MFIFKRELARDPRSCAHLAGQRGGLVTAQLARALPHQPRRRSSRWLVMSGTSRNLAASTCQCQAVSGTVWAQLSR